MGVVYLAHQRYPVDRRVALKVLKPGMDSREVVARFEQERQALAIMGHPGIAAVFDAGVGGLLRGGRASLCSARRPRIRNLQAGAVGAALHSALT